VSRLRPPLRIAWRLARRSPGRTVLIGALVGIPVLGAAFADTMVRTQNLTPSVRATRELGTADAEITVTSYPRIEGSDGAGATVTGGSGPSRDPRTVRLRELLPPGSRIVRAPRYVSAEFTLTDRRVVTDAQELDTEDPITAGLYAVREGRLPARAGEVGLTPGLAGRLGAAVGDTVRPDTGAPVTVVGLVAPPSCRRCDIAVGLPGWTGPSAATTAEDSIGYLVDWPALTGTEAALVASLAEHGIAVRLRDSILHPQRYRSLPPDRTAAGTALLIIGIGLLEVLLLAGAAFAVGARRQVRDAALMVANGGRRSDVRRMVLAQGVVLGLLGSVAGAALGVALVPAGWHWLQDWTLEDFGGLVLSPRDLLLIIALQVLVSVLAAVIPAIGAGRVPVLAGLSGRYGRPPVVRRRWQAVAGVGLVAAGLAVAYWSAGRWRADRLPQPLGAVPTGGTLHAAGVLLGVVLATLGLALSATGLLGLLGRLAHRLPLSARLAVRDAARHRHRTAPAVAAVMVAVTGSVALAQVVAGYDAHDRTHYVANFPIGAALVSAPISTQQEQRTDPHLLPGAHAAAAQLPATGEHPLWLLAGPRDRYLDFTPGSPSHCTSPIGGSYIGVSTATGLAELEVGPAQAARARAALAAGQAVITTDCLIGGSTLALKLNDTPLADLPAVVITGTQYWRLPTVFVSDRTAARLGLRTHADAVLITTSRAPTKGEEDKARGVVGGAEVDVEHGYGRPFLPGLIALIGAAALVTLGGVAISVSLTAAEGRADLATLAAVGASPRRRRALAGWQAAVIAGLGVLLGGALGTVTGQLVLHSMPDYPGTPAWPVLGAICVAVPLLGILVVTATTRSRLPMGRRLG
jgi:putative ABC transport system permease protein